MDQVVTKILTCCRFRTLNYNLHIIIMSPFIIAYFREKKKMNSDLFVFKAPHYIRDRVNCSMLLTISTD